jgi:hypothetical protein
LDQNNKTEYFLRGINDVSTERLRQIEEEGYGSSNDDSYPGGELAAAGASYGMHAAWNLAPTNVGKDPLGIPLWWPFDVVHWKPSDPRKNLVKAAALIIAEIDKIDRKEAQRGTIQTPT